MNTAAHQSLSRINDDIREMKRANRWMIVFCVAIVVLIAVAGVWPPRRGMSTQVTAQGT